MIALRQHIILGKANSLAVRLILNRFRKVKNPDAIKDVLDNYKAILETEIESKEMARRTMLLCMIEEFCKTEAEKFKYAESVLLGGFEGWASVYAEFMSLNPLEKIRPYEYLGENTGLQENILAKLNQITGDIPGEKLEKILEAIENRVLQFLQDVEFIESHMI